MLNRWRSCWRRLCSFFYRARHRRVGHDPENSILELRHILPVYPLLLMCAPSQLLGCGRARNISCWSRYYLRYLNSPARIRVPRLLQSICRWAEPRQRVSRRFQSRLGQDLKGVKVWMDAHDVKHINLCYFGTADPRTTESIARSCRGAG